MTDREEIVTLWVDVPGRRLGASVVPQPELAARAMGRRLASTLRMYAMRAMFAQRLGKRNDWGGGVRFATNMAGLFIRNTDREKLDIAIIKIDLCTRN